MLESLCDPKIVLDKIVTTENVHERVQGSSDAHVYQKHQGVRTARLIVHGLYGVTIALEPLKIMRQPVENDCPNDRACRY